MLWVLWAQLIQVTDPRSADICTPRTAIGAIQNQGRPRPPQDTAFWVPSVSVIWGITFSAYMSFVYFTWKQCEVCVFCVAAFWACLLHWGCRWSGSIVEFGVGWNIRPRHESLHLCQSGETVAGWKVAVGWNMPPQLQRPHPRQSGIPGTRCMFLRTSGAHNETPTSLHCTLYWQSRVCWNV